MAQPQKGVRGHRVSPRNHKEIREIAAIIRDSLGIPSGYINIQNLLEMVLPQVYEEFCYDIVEPSKLGADEARTYPGNLLIEIRSDVYDLLCENNGTARFTLAHELGHLFLHKQAVLARGSQDHAWYEDSEWQADAFAAEFLMPYQECVECKSYQQIMIRFGVSDTAARIRFQRTRQK